MKYIHIVHSVNKLMFLPGFLYLFLRLLIILQQYGLGNNLNIVLCINPETERLVKIKCLESNSTF